MRAQTTIPCGSCSIAYGCLARGTCLMEMSGALGDAEGATDAKATGAEKDEARLWLITCATEAANEKAEQGNHGLAAAFRNLADELGEAPTDLDELRACIRRTRPEYAHTLDWDEHPEEWDDECWCYECIRDGSE